MKPPTAATTPQVGKPRHRTAPWIKGVVSAGILWHFTSLFFVAVAPPMPGFAPSALVAGIYDRLFRTQMEFLALNNPNRYYAPNVSPFTQAWFRVRFAGGAVRWMELPGQRNPFLPARWQQRMGIAQAVQGTTAARPGDPGQQFLTPLGRVLLASYARHVAGEMGRAGGAVAEVQIYGVVHRIRLPDEVRRGWLATDLRLYAPRYLGTWLPDGSLKADDGTTAHRCPNIPMSVFAATMLGEDVLPILPDVAGPARAKALEELHIPAPVAHLLREVPSLAQSREGAELRQAIIHAVESQDAYAPGAAAPAGHGGIDPW